MVFNIFGGGRRFACHVYVSLSVANCLFGQLQVAQCRYFVQ
jgi:hypothetical protein